MTDKPTTAQAAWTSKQFEDIDNELARLAVVCRVDLIDRGNIERVIRNDASVCGTSNPLAFARMRDLLMMHYATRIRGAGRDRDAGDHRCSRRADPRAPRQTGRRALMATQPTLRAHPRARA